jgi:hypothetical protein
MMTLRQLVHLVETRSEELAIQLVEKVKRSEATPDYRNVPEGELRDRVFEVYRHLGDWLLAKDEEQVERRYTRIGEERAVQHVPFNQVAWVIVFTKENLWDVLEKQPRPQHQEPAYSELELLKLLNHFFDRALCYAAMGYDRRHAAE